jgi:prepilin-type N-terminal cleavage/methylation domain-containing protein
MMSSPRSRIAGFTLLELLLVLLVVAIVASTAINATSVDATTAITSVAQQVSADLAYCRSLAIVHGSRYEIEFVVAENRYTIRHSGPEAGLHILPPSPFRRSDDPADEHRVFLSDIPSLGTEVLLRDVVNVTTGASASAIEFGPLGETTSSQPMRIWLVAGASSQPVYLPIDIDPTTGLGMIGSMQYTPPVPAAEPNIGTQTKTATVDETGMTTPDPDVQQTS